MLITLTKKIDFKIANSYKENLFINFIFFLFYLFFFFFPHNLYVREKTLHIHSVIIWLGLVTRDNNKLHY